MGVSTLVLVCRREHWRPAGCVIVSPPYEQTRFSEIWLMRSKSLLGNPGQAMPGAEMNASCFHILFVAGLWVERGTPGFSHGDCARVYRMRKPCDGMSFRIVHESFRPSSGGCVFAV